MITTGNGVASEILGAEPTDPIAAATHPDPYPYYARLVAEQPMYRDERLGLWVASSAAAVMDVLGSELCHVRPPTEPVPRALIGTTAGEIFRQLVRMNDGENHCPFKNAIVATIDGIDIAAVSRVASERAAALAETLSPHRNPAGLTRFLFAFPVETIATLLGVPSTELGSTVEHVAAFVRAISPIAEAAEIVRGNEAAGILISQFSELLEGQRREGSAAVLSKLAREAQAVRRGAEGLIVANGIGFMSQTYEATAGLIGNTLLALARHREVLAAVHATPALLGNVIREVLHLDPPTQSTRRFVVRSGDIAGRRMEAGEAILVMLAAAGRDPAVNPHGARFAIHREASRILNFGVGVHACPAHDIVPRIAQAALAHLLAAGFDPGRLDRPPTYRRSNHVRVPIFG